MTSIMLQVRVVGWWRSSVPTQRGGARAAGAEHDREHEADLERRRDDGGEEHQRGDELPPVVPELLGAAEHRGGRLVPDGREPEHRDRSSRPRRAPPRRAPARACGRASRRGGARAPGRSAGSAPTRPARAPGGAAAGRSRAGDGPGASTALPYTAQDRSAQDRSCLASGPSPFTWPAGRTQAAHAHGRLPIPARAVDLAFLRQGAAGSASSCSWRPPALPRWI